MIKRILFFPLFCLFCAALPNCGGDDDDKGSSGQALCKKFCECAGQGGDCDKQCSGSGSENPGGGDPPEGCDADKLLSDMEACLSKECNEFTTCIFEASSDCGGVDVEVPDGG
jgi:hypothetical protein